jgi:hypothetical protein
VGATVLSALSEAGWFEGRRFDATGWIDLLGSVGYVVHDLARRIYGEFGGLTIESSPARVPSSSLWIDPVDACIDSFDESRVVANRLGVGVAPLGMWSVQFRSYIGADGRVLAVAPSTVWELGGSFAEALTYVVDGDGGPGRATRAEWLNA